MASSSLFKSPGTPAPQGFYDHQGRRNEMDAYLAQERGMTGDILQGIESGQTSVAQQQMQAGLAGTQRAMAGQAAAGGANPLAARSATYAGGQAGVDVSRASAALRAQEMQAAQQMHLGSLQRGTEGVLQQQGQDATAIQLAQAAIAEERMREQMEWDKDKDIMGMASFGLISDPSTKNIIRPQGPARVGEAGPASFAAYKSTGEGGQAARGAGDRLMVRRPSRYPDVEQPVVLEPPPGSVSRGGFAAYTGGDAQPRQWKVIVGDEGLPQAIGYEPVRVQRNPRDRMEDYVYEPDMVDYPGMPTPLPRGQYERSYTPPQRIRQSIQEGDYGPPAAPSRGAVVPIQAPMRMGETVIEGPEVPYGVPQEEVDRESVRWDQERHLFNSLRDYERVERGEPQRGERDLVYVMPRFERTPAPRRADRAPARMVKDGREPATIMHYMDASGTVRRPVMDVADQIYREQDLRFREDPYGYSVIGERGQAL